MHSSFSQRYLATILRVTGAITMLGGLQFFAPLEVLKLSGMALTDETGLFFARHWGMLVLCLGGLLFYSAGHRALRLPVMLVVTLEKLALVLMVIGNGANPALAGLRPAALFDGACVLLFSFLLWRGQVSAQNGKSHGIDLSD